MISWSVFHTAQQYQQLQCVCVREREADSHAAEAGLKFFTEPRMTLMVSPKLCYLLLRVQITGVNCLDWFMLCWESNPGHLCALLVELQPQWWILIRKIQEMYEYHLFVFRFSTRYQLLTETVVSRLISKFLLD